MGQLLSILPMIMGAGGTALTMNAKAQEQNNMNKALAVNQNMEANFQKAGDQTLQQHMDQSSVGNANKEIGQGASDAMNKYAALQQTPAIGVSGANTAPTASQSVVSDDSKARTGLLNEAAAPVQGLGDWQVQQWIDALKAKTKLGQINQGAERWNALLPAQLGAAQNSKAGEEGIGSLLSSLGNIAGVMTAGSGGGQGGQTQRPNMPQGAQVPLWMGQSQPDIYASATSAN